MTAEQLKVCVVGQHASLQFGGEASAPWFHFKFLRDKGVDAHLVAHVRTRDELRRAFADDFDDRVHLIGDSRVEGWVYWLGQKLPGDLDSLTLTVVRHWLAQRRQRKVIAALVRAGKVNVIHETSPVAPKQISALHGLGVPLVIGPLSGGMTFPPAFKFRQGRSRVWAERVSRAVAGVANVLVPGKRRAAALLVANDLTRDALPGGYRGKVYPMSEISVDRTTWAPRPKPANTDGTVRFVYLGRLVNWKGVDLLIEAFAGVAKQVDNAVLEILGDGSDRAELERQAATLKIANRVTFAGYVKAAVAAERLAAADVFVLPSLRECGGIVVVEAMAVGLPVVAVDWAGPSVHVTDETGVRVSPASRDELVRGMTDAMVRLARSPDLRRQMGEAGQRRVAVGDYDWSQKVDHCVRVYLDVLNGAGGDQR